MFGDLFAEDEDDDYSSKSRDRNRGSGWSSSCAGPPAPRNQCSFAGIQNRGATCYLNTLLQTLFLTPEFREALFTLGAEELGHIADHDKPGSKVRVIPIELQRLFAKLLFLDQEACSTQELTDSFGWNDNEEFQQQDVQELNRILFSAIEDSLVGTSGQELIGRLFHGNIVNQIKCDECGTKSEREEDFLDLTLAMTGFVGVKDTLRAYYEEVELMQGNNQYKCSRCRKLVNARKGAKIRSLPPILTLSLLRFSYNFERGERYKETGHYTFPMEMDMSPYCDGVDPANTQYELFSVVIHSGSTHGGHYHAYIRDVDALGVWFPPEETPIQLKSNPAEGSIDFVDISSPQQLISMLIRQFGDNIQSMEIDKLCQVLVQETGVSWNKRFKRHHGAINKFLKRFNDIFELDSAMCRVSLKDPFQNQQDDDSPSRIHSSPKDSRASESSGTSNGKNEEVLRKGDAQSKEGAPPPAAGYCWLDFNDSHVRCIHKKSIQTQYAGRESAYMLFYRRKSLVRPKEAMSNKLYNIPDWLLTEVQQANEYLQMQREEYDLSVNKINITLAMSEDYEWSNGALQCTNNSEVNPRSVSLDRRKTVAELKTAVYEVVDSSSANQCFHLAKDLPSGLHLYECISADDTAVLRSIDISDNSIIFIWDGKQVDDMPIRTGTDCEPILLKINYASQDSSVNSHFEIERGFSKDTTLYQLHYMITALTDIPEESLRISRIFKEKESICLELGETTLREVGLKDNDRILAEGSEEKGSLTDKSAALMSSVQANLKKLLNLTMENRCCESDDSGNFPTAELEVSKDLTVGVLTSLIAARFYRGEEDKRPKQCRLRVEDDHLGLQAPLHTERTLEEAGVKKGFHLILEPGLPPTSDEITITYVLESLSTNKSWEMQVEGSSTLSKCFEQILHLAGTTSRDYHLCKPSWYHEDAEVLDDMDLTLEEAKIQDGEVLLLKAGRLPPKGFIRIPAWLHYTPERGFITTSTPQEEAVWIAEQTKDLLAALLSESKFTEVSDSLPEPSHHAMLGQIEISHDANLQELKMQLFTLPALASVCLPSADFLRVRVLESGRPGRVLRELSQSLRFLKITASSQLAVQLLPFEEQLTSTSVLLNLCQRIPDTRTYSPQEEFIWDTSNHPSPESLYQSVADAILIPIERVVLAKKQHQKFEWIVIPSKSQNRNMPQKSGKKKTIAKAQTLTNLKQGPYSIRDGDTVAMKDIQFDPLGQDDFSTIEDDLGKEQLRQQAEEKKRQRQEKKTRAAQWNENSGSSQKVEKGLSIKVPDFTS